VLCPDAVEWQGPDTERAPVRVDQLAKAITERM
jgi:hypothetical protein